MLPSASQGYIAIECLNSNLEIINILRKINNEKQMILAQAERSFVSALNGSCLSPIAVLCTEKDNNILISAKVLSQDGKDKIYKELSSSYENISKDITSLANDFIANDAHNLILK
jgi:hydroxymethylbilane synthase